jgi:hypothetical protein
MSQKEKVRLQSELMTCENELKKCEGPADAKYAKWLKCKIEETREILGIPTLQNPLPKSIVLYYKEPVLP